MYLHARHIVSAPIRQRGMTCWHRNEPVRK